jgi:hypothetical protein
LLSGASNERGTSKSFLDSSGEVKEELFMEKGKYVCVPWATFVPLWIMLIGTIIVSFLNTGVVVFNMPIETFIVCWLSFPYIIICAVVHITRGNKEA